MALWIEETTTKITTPLWYRVVTVLYAKPMPKPKKIVICLSDLDEEIARS